MSRQYVAGWEAGSVSYVDVLFSMFLFSQNLLMGSKILAEKIKTLLCTVRDKKSLHALKF